MSNLKAVSDPLSKTNNKLSTISTLTTFLNLNVLLNSTSLPDTRVVIVVTLTSVSDTTDWSGL